MSQASTTDVKQLLSEGIHTLKYKKADGTLRFAVATTKAALIPQVKEEDFEKLLEAYKVVRTSFQRIVDDHPGTEIEFESTMELLKKTDKKYIEIQSTAVDRKPNDSLVAYYDFEAKAFRSFKIENLVEIKALER